MIGIFDSGSGGLTVASAIRRRAPMLDIVYFGDVANAPYGSRGDDELQQLTLKGIQLLREQGAQEIVSACNSISAKVIRPMAQLMGSNHSSIVEMVGPTAVAAAVLGEKKWVAIATPATVESNMYQEAFIALGMNIEMIACPNLAGTIEFEESKEVLNEKIRSAIEQAVQHNPDYLLLGCTHYPLVRKQIEDELKAQGSNAQVFDPADAVACETITRFGAEGSGRTKVFTSKQSDGFERRVKETLGDVEIVSL
jgi:glutamate racemase